MGASEDLMRDLKRKRAGVVVGSPRDYTTDPQTGDLIEVPDPREVERQAAERARRVKEFRPQDVQTYD